ncbi:MAG: hypothetical protein U0325_11780 [Polyangiales bacterium]
MSVARREGERGWGLARGALLALHAVGPLRHLGMDAWDYDEGPTLQAASLALHGARLYRDVPLNKPPLLVMYLHGALRVLGEGLTQGRAASLLLGVLGLAALSSLATAWWGAPAGALLLALLLLVRELPERLAVAMSDLPALSAAALALAAAWRARGRAGAGLWGVSGLALAAAALLHPLLVGVLLPWAMSARGAPPRRAGLALATALVTTGAVLAAFPWVDLHRWVVDYNRAPVDALAIDGAGVTLRRWLREDLGWCVAAGLATAWLLARPETRRATAVSAAWMLVTVLTLRAWRPLWENYRVWPEVMLAMPVAGALAQLQGRRRAAWLALPVAALLAPGPRWPAWTAERVAARAWIASQPADVAVLSDDPLLAFAAGRRVPAALADTSWKRVATGYLRLDEVRAAAGRGRAVAVFATGRFDRLAGMRAWCASRATAVFRAGAVTGYAMDLRALPPGPSPSMHSGHE